METKNIKQTVIFKAKPEEIYNLYMDAEKHSAFTGGKAIMPKRAGCKYSNYDGYITGKIIELVKNKKIVQSWQANEDDWDKNHFSEVTLLFTETPEGTKLDFTQTGVPAAKVKAIEKGWIDYYWEPMKKEMLKKA